MTEENSDRPFVLEDCPKNENGHWMAKTRGGRDVLIYTDKHVDENHIIFLGATLAIFVSRNGELMDSGAQAVVMY